MITIRRSDERGHIRQGWLNTYHTFSFADYYDDDWVHFRALRVMNEDRIAASQGFGMHPHRDMEIITYVLSGAVQHSDSMGNSGIIKPGDVQRMSAGTGIFHSEINPLDEELYLYQIWIMPKQKSVTPSYEQKRFENSEKKNQLRLVASPDGADGSVTIGQDTKLFASLLEKGKSVSADIGKGRAVWVQCVSGNVSVNGIEIKTGDAAAITEEEQLVIEAKADSHLLVFDLN
ncbi:MAG: pirin family protein [Candidatus Kapaibacterium sp.]